MPEPRILPLGFIDRTTDDGAIIMLTRTSESHDIQPDTPVTLRNRSTEATPATARVRGVITSVGYVTATFKTVETRQGSQLAPRPAGTPTRTTRLPSIAQQFQARPSQNNQRGKSGQPRQAVRTLPRNNEAATSQNRQTTPTVQERHHTRLIAMHDRVHTS